MRMDDSAGSPVWRNDKREDPSNLESSPVRDEGKAISKVDNRFSTCPDIPYSSPHWRSSRKNKLDQENKKKRLARNCRKAGSKIALLDVSSLQFTRGRRSSLCKKARATAWGLLGNVAPVLDQNCSIDVSPQEPNTSRRHKGIEGHGKRETKKKKVRNSSKLKGKRFTASGPISLKIKFGGKETVRLMNVRAITDDNKEEYSKTEKYFPEASIDVQDFLKKEVKGSMSFQSGGGNLGKASDVHRVMENITENADGNNDFCESPFRAEVDNVVVTVDNQILDSGSSPDSEVINLTPDAQICEKDPEAFNLAMDSTQIYLASENPNLRLLCKDAYKGKRDIEHHQTPGFGINVEVPSLENTVDVPKFSKLSQKDQVGELLYHSDDSTSTTEIASVNASEVEKFPKQPLCSEVTDLAIASELSKVGSGVGAGLSSRLGLELGSVESDISKNPCTHGQKLAKSSRPRKATKSSLKTPKSSRRKKTSEKEGSQEKSSGKQKGKDKGLKDDFAQTLHEVENHHVTETGGTGSGNKSLAGDTSQNTMVPVAMVQQCLPLRQAWVCCDDCEKWRRIPAALADQVAKNDRWVCKDNMDKDFADCSIPQEMSDEDINAELDLSDPCCEEDACDVRLDKVELMQKQQKVTEPPSWMRIKSNLFLHRRRKTQPIDEVMVCHCKADTEGRVGCGDGCLNRMLNIECMQGTCPCGEFCSNQQFQKRKYAKLKSIKCGRKGFGLQLLEDVSEGQFLIEYVGEVLDMHAYESRQRDYAVKGHKHFYFMTLNGSEVIDACAKGNLGRFINHSCDPNCRTEKWMVNGEVCIGIFALRDIKKGEEVTFNYNYVRVFGAAAKKCVCGSSQCQGYIGGDPLKADIIVEDDSDDEYPDPVVVHGNGEMNRNLNNAIARAIKKPSEVKDHINGFVSVNRKIGMSSENLTTEMSNHAKINIDCSTTSARCLEITKESGDLRRSASTALSGTISEEKECSVGQHLPAQLVGTSLQSGDITSESVSSASEEYSATEKSINNPSCTNQGSDANFQYAVSDKIYSKMKVKFDVGEVGVVLSKSHARTKTSKKSSTVEKRPKTDSLDTKKHLEIDVKVHLPPSKPKRFLEDLSNGHFEAVQEKLNELLDNDGGISKRKDASRGYLKLLLLTAASGNSGNGETIESNRDLSMILDALLKTKSRTVLVDIINKNGLQMLHNIMKRCRKEFIKIPILRKLLKVLEYLATRDILTSEHINGGPRCPGVESFRDSILSLTEHADKQVHQIARSFRDRWIPRSFRKFGCIDRDDCRTEFHRDSTHDSISASHANSSDCAPIPSEKLDGITKPVLALNSADAQMPDVSAGSRGSRKRKSRWDQPTKGSPNLGADTSMAADGANMYEDVPPGFSAPLNCPMVPSDAYVSDVGHKKARSSQAKHPYEVTLGHPQPIFTSRSPVTYGMPVSIVQQFGTYQAETSENWIVAPGMPFQPFPPLPPYPRDKSKHSTMSQAGQKADQESHSRATNLSQNPPSTSGVTGVGMETISQPNFQRVRCPQNLPRKYYRQEKWNRSAAGALQIQKKNGWESMGNNSSNGMSQAN